ncbi:MAG TPA: sigma-54 dependent transcriptional regulator [Candidatus Competibacter sp.]|nr:sigma-54-dependent Fis family transcriptional regulator [Candidatus Competibacteraceae bacterium]HPE70695.1 sigma-54 dependent transcriptional regulator [Candidatus Competibacter sp.]HRX71272.1 sigma-54 dependent transcriptional regulator [Candidatus Competibacteraceae bacterium]
MPPCLLVIDDDAALNLALCTHFEDRGWRVTGVHDCAAGLTATIKAVFDVILLDVQLPDGDGVELLSRLLKLDPHLPVILITGGRDVERAMQAIAAGAFDWLPKPFEPAELERLVDRALATRQASATRATEIDDAPLRTLVGASRALLEIGKTLARVAPSDTRVLITGESGTGKEVIARLVHIYSGRRGPFVAVNCAALVETLLESELFGHERGAFTGAHAAKPGKFEQAAEGTLFLDEVGELPPTMQAKLLRVLQEGVFERVGGTQTLTTRTRIVAATNRDLFTEVTAGRFREDLLYRLAVVTLHVPPLRERREDILPLARHLLARACRRLDRPAVTLTPDAEERLRARDWPGNVRELDNVLARALLHARGPVLTVDLLDARIAAPPDTAAPPNAFRDPSGRLYALDELEAIQVANALHETNGHKGRACAILGISRPALERKLDRYGLRPRAHTED